MPKRSKVPATLHAELTEYSSLLRALRTSHTLDLTSRLINPPPAHAASASVLSSVGDDEDDVNDPPVPHGVPSELESSVYSGDQVHEQPANTKGKGRQRNTWFTWPLCTGDVHVPEWGLADEVQLIAKTVLRSSPDDPVEEEDNLDRTSSTASTSDDEDVPSLSSPVLHALTADSAAFLSRILALLAAHVPVAKKRMQQRIRPIDWETVLDIVCTHGITSTSVASLVRTRMARLYPSQRDPVVPRAEHLLHMKTQVAEMFSKHDDRLFAVPSPTPEGVNRKRRRDRKRDAELAASHQSKRQRKEEG